MSLISTLLLTVLLSANLAAQTPPTAVPPDITIKSVRWSVRSGPTRYEEWSGRSDFKLESKRATPPQSVDHPTRPSSLGWTKWSVYSVEFTNGPKPIRAVAWEYVLSERDSGKELRRQLIFSFEGIGPNKTGTLTGTGRGLPWTFVDDKGKVNYPNPLITERAEFKCIVYKDDSTWCRPDASRTLSDDLRQAASRKR